MWEEDRADVARRRVVWLAGIAAAAVVAAGLWYWYVSQQHAAAPPTARQAAPQPAASTEPQISHPIPAESPPAALPALNDSDQVMHDSLAGVLGRESVERFLVPQNIVRHIVVTVDNLPRHKVAVELRPVKPTPGEAVTATSGGDLTTLGEANFERYAPLVRVVQGADVKALAVVYERLYPLFQQAYEDLGYPGKYFNDRLVQAIDDLLAAPEVPAPIPVVQPKVFWEYADAGLEGRSAGQKLLIRMGPTNARVIKAKLREFRAEIAKKK
jgi:hypothetical protein